MWILRIDNVIWSMPWSRSTKTDARTKSSFRRQDSNNRREINLSPGCTMKCRWDTRSLLKNKYCPNLILRTTIKRRILILVRKFTTWLPHRSEETITHQEYSNIGKIRSKGWAALLDQSWQGEARIVLIILPWIGRSNVFEKELASSQNHSLIWRKSWSTSNRWLSKGKRKI